MRTATFVAFITMSAVGGAVLGVSFAPATAPVPAPAPPPGPPPAPPPAAALLPPTPPSVDEEKVARLEELLAAARAEAAPGKEPAPGTVTRDQMAGLIESVGKQVTEKDARIRDLEAEIARLKATLPEPEVLHDLRAGSVDELIALGTALRNEVQGRLLTPPEALAARFSDFLLRPSSGTARILPRGKYNHVIDKREGGAYWSFVTKDNDYNKEPDLELQAGNFGSGFYGSSKGWFLALGATDPNDVGQSVAASPPGLDEAQLAQWRHLWSESPFTGAKKWQEAAKPFAEWKRVAGDLKIPSRVPAIAEHTYLLRSMLPGEHDVLVLFHTTMADDTGMSLVWQVLRSWEVPPR